MTARPARLFAEAVRDSVRDYARDNPRTISIGYFVGKLRRGAPDVPAMIDCIDHEPGNPANVLDTGAILVAEIGGEVADPLDVMALRERRPITATEYRWRVADLEHAKNWRADDPLAQPTRKVDLGTLKPQGPSR